MATTPHEHLEDSLEYQLARQSVADYSDAAPKRGAAIHAADCEQLLAKGIGAYRWLDRVETTLRQAAYEGRFDWNPQIELSLAQLYSSWFLACDGARRLVDELTSQGDRPSNLEQFEAICSEAEDRAERQEWLKASMDRLDESSGSEPW
jgi:hypothetical protein